MTLEELQEHIEAICTERSGNIAKGQVEMREILIRIEEKIDEVNGRSRQNAWSIKAIWGIFGAVWGAFLIWLRAKLG